MKLGRALVPACPVCGFSSIYTDGDGPCSVRCALRLAHSQYQIHQVPLPKALSVVREEAESRGLPQEPHIRDIREPYYRYVVVQERRAQAYWDLDRAILAAGLNVEYLWIARGNRKIRSRVYRFAPSLLAQLPESMLDHKVRNLSRQELRFLCDEFPNWRFLAAK